MLKRPQDGRPKFPIFFKNRPKMIPITVFGPRCLLEASKSVPKASRDLPIRQITLKNRPKSSQNPAPDLSKTAPKRCLMLQTPKIKNNATLHTKTSFLTFPDPRKWSRNRRKNALKIRFILDTLLEHQQIQFLMMKRRQDGSPKFVFFFENRPQILALTVFGPRCLLEASKKPPRPSQEPPRATQEPPRAAQDSQEAPDT